MGFTQTTSRNTYKNTVQSLTAAANARLSNPYAKWNDKKPTVVTYYNLDYKASTLDTGKKDTYDQLGKKSPLRYNKINNFVLYGLPRFPVDIDMSDYGPESQTIGGQALILPKTIIPSADDYFTVNYLKEGYLFRVTKQSIDSVENDMDTNFYQITFELDNTRLDWIKALNSKSLNLNRVYNFSIENVGTNKACLLSEEDENSLSTLLDLYDTLRDYYVNLFWRPNVQAFICGYINGMWFYDPYLTEFMIRNQLFVTDDELKYLFIEQATHRPSTFYIEYDHTVFKDIEDANPQMHTNSGYLVPVHDPNSLLVDRMEEYFEMSINLHHADLDPVNQLNNNLFDLIQRNKPFDEKDTTNNVLYWNIIINYMNGADASSLTEAQLNSLKNLKYKYCKDLFYEIPILMYILRGYAGQLEQGFPDNTVSENDETYGKLLEKCYNVRK
jgi:hypothetical protein